MGSRLRPTRLPRLRYECMTSEFVRATSSKLDGRVLHDGWLLVGPRALHGEPMWWFSRLTSRLTVRATLREALEGERRNVGNSPREGTSRVVPLHTLFASFGCGSADGPELVNQVPWSFVVFHRLWELLSRGRFSEFSHIAHVY